MYQMNIEDLKKRYLSGESCYSIAKSYGVSFRVISRRLEHELGSLRSLNEANDLQGRIKQCVICGALFKFKQKDTQRKLTCSRPCLVELKRRNNHLENHPAWLGGRQTYRKILFDELSYESKCQACGSSDSIEVHHIDKDRKNNQKGNLAVLCRRCHKSWHFDNGDLFGKRNPYFRGSSNPC